MRADIKKLAVGLVLAATIVGCGSDSGEKGAISRADFVKEFTTGFGTSTGIESAKIDCVGGKVYDGLSAEALETLGENGLEDGAEPPQAVKDVFAPAFAECLDFGDLLKAAGSSATAGLDADCLTENVEFTNADEIAFWNASLNGETPPSTFSDQITAAATTCMGG